MSSIVMSIIFFTLILAISFLFSSARQFVFAILDIINARPISALAWPVEWLLDLCGGQASIAWDNWFVDFVRNALLLRRTSPRWSVGANINFRPWQQVAKGWGSKTSKERGGWRGGQLLLLLCVSLFMRNLPIYTNFFGLIGLKRKEQRKPFACLGQLAAIAFASFSLLSSPLHLAWVSVNGYSYGFTSARHPWTCHGHGHGQDIMFAPHIFCLPFARIYINRAPSRWLSFPCAPSPHLLFHWGCHGCQLSIVFTHRQRICWDVQLAALEIGLERAWWISRNSKDATLPWSSHLKVLRAQHAVP